MWLQGIQAKFRPEDSGVASGERVHSSRQGPLKDAESSPARPWPWSGRTTSDGRTTARPQDMDDPQLWADTVGGDNAQKHFQVHLKSLPDSVELHAP